MTAFKFKKSIQLLNFFAISTKGNLNKMKSLKLMWAAERWHLRNYGITIIDDDFFAMKLGPVPSYTKDMAEGCNFLSEEELEYRKSNIESVDNYSFRSLNKFEDSLFSQSAIKAMEISFKEFSKYSPFDLADITHLYPEWSKFSHLIPSVYSRVDMDYIDFFKDPQVNSFSIFNQDIDLLNIMRDMFLDQRNLQKAVYSL
jgi:uncharacterized phage-associated protein